MMSKVRSILFFFSFSSRHITVVSWCIKKRFLFLWHVMEFLYYPFRIHIRAQKVTQNAYGVLPRLLFRPFCPFDEKKIPAFLFYGKLAAWRFQRPLLLKSSEESFLSRRRVTQDDQIWLSRNQTWSCFGYKPLSQKILTIFPTEIGYYDQCCTIGYFTSN